MKNLLLLLIGVFTLVPQSGFTQPEPVWTLKKGIQNPESVYLDPVSKFIFVSNVAGTPDQKDGKGWLSKLSHKGRVIQSHWVDGLNAPKGMRAHNGVLWVTDIDQVLSIEISSGKVLEKIRVFGAKFLNDIAIADDGKVFVSDTLLSRIFVVDQGKAFTYVKGSHLESPNGLLIRGGTLYVAAWGFTTDWSTKTSGNLYSIDLKTRKKTLITSKPLGNLDGLEFDQKGDFIVSDFMSGKIYRVTHQGVPTLLLQGKQGWADIGYDFNRKQVLVPSMQESHVMTFAID